MHFWFTILIQKKSSEIPGVSQNISNGLARGTAAVQ